jgi:hypothetical protein
LSKELRTTRTFGAILLDFEQKQLWKSRIELNAGNEILHGSSERDSGEGGALPLFLSRWGLDIIEWARLINTTTPRPALILGNLGGLPRFGTHFVMIGPRFGHSLLAG